MRKRIFFLYLSYLIGLALPSQSQIVSRKLASTKAATGVVTTGMPTLTLPTVDPTPLLAEDEREAALGRPFRFGIKQVADVTLPRDGGRSPANGHTLVRYRIEATGAFSINLLFDQFRLANGAEFSLYNADSTFLVGPITSAQNPANNQCWTDLIPGSVVILELREPTNASTPSQIHLRGVVHGYKNTFPDGKKAFGGAGFCEKNVACYPTYQNEADGVAMILLADGTRWCTGSLLNSATQQFRSFLLTAFHCLDLNSNNVLESGESGAVQNWLFRFGYQSPDCANTTENLNFVTLGGADIRATRNVSDFLLLELKSQIPAAINPTYLGWDRSANLPSSMVGIHHPMGDVKKISFALGSATLTDANLLNGTTHFRVQWGDLGVTEPGSSGSPILNANRQVVGQLYGGPSQCGASTANKYDLYGRFALSWNGGTTSDTRLRDWLDASNIFQSVNGVKPTITGPATLTGNSSFVLNSVATGGITWTVAAPAGVMASQVVSVTSGAGSRAGFSALSSATNLTITYAVSAGQTYPIRFSRVFNVQAPTTSLSASAVTPNSAAFTAALTILEPLYNCATRQLTLRTSGGSSVLPVEYVVVGVTPWVRNQVIQIPDGVMADRQTTTLMLMARQFNGVDPPTQSSRPFNFRAACPN